MILTPESRALLKRMDADDALNAAAQAGWNAAIEASAQICWSMQARPEFEPEFHDRMLKQAEDRIRALKDAK